jgi:hypothetical protein
MTMVCVRKSATLVAMANLAVAVSVLNAIAGVQKSFERTFRVNGAVEIEARTGSEDLKIRTGDNGSVLVKCVIKPQGDRRYEGADIERISQLLEAHLPVHQEGNQIVIGRLEDREMLRHVNVLYELLVPLDTRLTYETDSGDLAVEGIQGPVEFTSGSGDIHLASVRESIHAHTGSGDVILEGVGKSSVEVETTSGDVKLNLAPESGYDLSAHTVSGDFSIAPEFTLEPGDTKNDVRGRVRGGGSPVKISTVSGDIRID